MASDGALGESPASRTTQRNSAVGEGTAQTVEPRFELVPGRAASPGTLTTPQVWARRAHSPRRRGGQENKSGHTLDWSIACSGRVRPEWARVRPNFRDIGQPMEATAGLGTDRLVGTELATRVGHSAQLTAELRAVSVYPFPDDAR
jgi:hypothetical protein